MEQDELELKGEKEKISRLSPKSPPDGASAGFSLVGIQMIVSHI